MNEIEKVLQERFMLQEEYLGNNKLVNEIIPLVSITVTTYQHVHYIRECLEGILMQKTNFPYEIILGEDGSVDGTQEICKEYAEKYPDKIRLFIRDRNLSQYLLEDGHIVRFNGIWNRIASRGKYIAWCEGDDYWIDPLKLQKQVSFLELNSDYGLVHSYVKVYNERNKEFSDELIGADFDNLDQLIIGNRIVTLTACLRRDLCEAYFRNIAVDPSWKMGDYPMWLYISSHSKVHFLNEITGVYRVLENSVSHSKDPRREVDFRLSACEISLFFAKELNKQYLFPVIKQRALNLILFLYVKNNRSVDSHFWQIVKKLKFFSLKIIAAALIAKFEYGRCFLRRKYLQ